MSGVLYLVAVPIGNQEDISLRAKNVLQRVDVIACEDTRITGILLNTLSIEPKKLISYYDKIEDKKSKELSLLLKEGKSIAIVSDAGTPCISDPGYYITKSAHENHIKVVSVPGASAVTVALAASGFPAVPYKFIGFFPKKEIQKQETVKNIPEKEALVFFESPNRIRQTLKLFQEYLPKVEMFVIREITKKYEEYYKGTPESILIEIKEKGEFTCVCYINQKIDTENPVIDKLINKLRQQEISNRDIVTIISETFNLPKNHIKNLL